MINQLSKASVGSPITRAGVSIFPVYLHQAAPGFLTGPDSRLQVTERPGASVPTLVVTNPNGVPVLITEGETLNGGWQNRVVNVSVLVPAAAELDIPVS
ncbi:MAG: ARPP-1 family domain-containing protein, partial [Ilumatobacteraceae bacterium]